MTLISPLKIVLQASLGLAVVAATTAAQAIDYSDNPLIPSEIFADASGNFTFTVNQAGAGNVCIVGSNCKDYVFFNVPTGRTFTGLTMDFYNSIDNRAFIALQAGSQFTAVQVGGSLVGALAYNHAGWRGLCAASYGALRPTGSELTNANCIQSDGLTPVPGRPTNLFTQVLTSNTPPSPTVTAPLPAGAYVIWTQQISGISEYTLTATTAALPVPGPLPVLGALGAFGWSRRLRRRIGRG
ncbi:MAG: hypothetical protein NT158_04790 [Cyanobacteria bacterium]|nr:hypothetical protein [Cyanobacteriota bacterium]